MCFKAYTKETTMLSHQLLASDKNTHIHNLQLREQYINPIAIIAYLQLSLKTFWF